MFIKHTIYQSMKSYSASEEVSMELSSSQKQQRQM